jgi:DNA-binding NtrC family response regulator
MNRSSVLVASQHPRHFSGLLDVLRDSHAWDVLIFDTDQTIRAVTSGSPIGLVILHGSLEFCEPVLRCFSRVRASRVPPPFIVVATRSSEDFAITSLRAGALDYLPDVNPGDFDRSISRLAPMNPPETVVAGGDVLVGKSATMQALRQHILRVAGTDCNVLITGETGTGKDLVAQLVHQNSSRKTHTMVSINCAAIPDSLLESELFGYERGSFTGANASNKGKLMSADKGTVFFDEIGDMSSYGQAKILRVIECREVQRLGSTRQLQTDIRVLAATHHNLDDPGTSQTFRRDLYFRLNVGRIHVPPLRERKNDIPDLAARMVLDLNLRFGRQIEGITEDGICYLAQHDWPGNVRELKNVVERVFIDRDNGWITAADLRGIVQRQAAQRRSEPFDEMQVLRTALVSCHWNKSKAAESLNWSRMTLYRKLAKYGLTDESGEPCTKADQSRDQA